jgi:hypothetical protein
MGFKVNEEFHSATSGGHLLHRSAAMTLYRESVRSFPGIDDRNACC